jgi:RNA polymerase sigma-70 factor (ECF subfamily)
MAPNKAPNLAGQATGSMPEAEADDVELTQLIAACAARNAQALRQLYDRTAPQLLACMVRILKRKALAEEALQDVFVSIWQRAGQFEARRGRPRAWLMSIARYRAIDVLRAERAELYREAEIEQLPQLVTEGASDWSGAGRSAAALARCFEMLSADQRRGIELAFVDGASHADIARVTHQPLGTVKSWIRRGLASLRQCLER